MTLLSPATDWTGQTNAERAEECARFLAVHGLIEVSECRRICDEARERGEGEVAQSPQYRSGDIA